MVKLLVVDQHPIVSKGLELVFNVSRDIKFMGSVDNGEAIFEFLKSTPVDVILTEIDLPKLNGLTAIRRIKKDFPDTKIIMFSAQSEDVYAVSSIKAGANGFVPKTAGIITLREAILKVYNNGMYLSNNLMQRLNKNSKDFKGSSYYKKLSTREVEVLKLLASGKRNKDIASELKINEKTVSTYRARLMKKLNVDNLVDLVNQSKTMEL
ncbi:LuxR family two component transcriptional regulator [Lacinutrix venerupis]|uniref:DNA-binding response regulator n=1 Tax=Lacinutrix venerupis TaxID=1486034 RepID=A0AAC9LL82_9FLAO|nr:response regulator transcription factor [Lacinutrix venerupis]APX99441.1 DNA-binding response regulator [Lacinutrix venerupis]RLJ61990.1 LuxR family two component transcriptional regulator [Lacinutrix venerupis]